MISSLRADIIIEQYISLSSVSWIRKQDRHETNNTDKDQPWIYPLYNPGLDGRKLLKHEHDA